MLKKFMSILALVSLLTVSAHAGDCEPMYKAQRVKAAVKSGLSTTGGAGFVALGAYAAVASSILGVFASNEGFVILGIAVGALSAGNGVVLTVSSVKNAVKFVGLFKALKLIRESKVGAGEHLEELAEDMNEERNLQGDERVTAARLAELINKGNDEKVFCVDSKNVYTKKVMVEWLESQLGF